MRWKKFLYYSRRERAGIAVLMVLILLSEAVSLSVPSAWTKDGTTGESFDHAYASFVASLSEQEHDRSVQSSYTSGRHRKQEAHLAPFDPNTTDSAGFTRLGLPPWMARNILRYRAKGGTFRQPEEFRKVYGLTEEQFATLLPYIQIAEKPGQKDTVRLLAQHVAADSLQFYKYPAGTVIDLNRADTTELKKIPGIGSSIARMIVGYRKQLGGFYRIEQLSEIRLATDKLHTWFSVRPGDTQRINLNKAGIERINAHPYISFYQAKVIVEYRRKKGELKSLQQLKLYEEFTPQDFERIEPYVCF